MATKRREKQSQDWRSDWWLLVAALLFVVTGLGQTVWMWEHTAPVGFAPLTLLLWVGVTVAGLTLPIYWLARRWQPVAWVSVGAWVAVPKAHDVASHYFRTVETGDEWLVKFSPVLLLLLLGLGLGGAMISIAGLVTRRWSGSVPNIRPWRESFFAGLFAVVCGELLINRVFAIIPVSLLSSALILFETSFMARESSR